jgi:hypothetical protein
MFGAGMHQQWMIIVMASVYHRDTFEVGMCTQLI